MSNIEVESWINQEAVEKFYEASTLEGILKTKNINLYHFFNIIFNEITIIIGMIVTQLILSYFLFILKARISNLSVLFLFEIFAIIVFLILYILIVTVFNKKVINLLEKETDNDKKFKREKSKTSKTEWFFLWTRTTERKYYEDLCKNERISEFKIQYLNSKSIKFYDRIINYYCQIVEEKEKKLGIHQTEGIQIIALLMASIGIVDFFFGSNQVAVNEKFIFIILVTGMLYLALIAYKQFVLPTMNSLMYSSKLKEIEKINLICNYLEEYCIEIVAKSK